MTKKKSIYVYGVPAKEVKITAKMDGERKRVDYSEYTVESPVKIIKDDKEAKTTTEAVTEYIENQEPTLETTEE